MASSKSYRGHAGHAYPLGATVLDKGVNFSIFSRSAASVDLLLFDHPDDGKPSRLFSLSAKSHRTYHYWHVFAEGVQPGQLYAYRVHGQSVPHVGLRFDSNKLLLDPYGRAVVVPKDYSREAAWHEGDNTSLAMKNVVVDNCCYDWEGDEPLQHPAARTIIYEMHVRGFTRHPNSGVPEGKRGTYAGLIEKIPYLQELGITAVELMPVFQFDAQDCPPGLVNYWGYAPISFFAPHQAYSSRHEPTGAVDEFRDMVKALHRAGIEVILDVVFNHTAEGNEHGPMLSFRGIDNPTYYILENGGANYADYTGCGNTLNANNTVVRRLILDSLRYWVQEMHVDGFRFDLASILARDSSGQALPSPPVLWDIESDPALAGTKLLAEAWDAAGLYQVGSFVGDAWKEWNGRFRDDVRDFFRASRGSVRRIADRILGSPQIYGHEQREAEQSVNFVTCHDGFTLNDLVSYNQKHNEGNREYNRDGTNDNRSWNCGVEGPSNDPEIEALRKRQIKNFFTVNLLSLGIPMVLMGDEVRRTQHGNNNAYCQDNEISWLDWHLTEANKEIHRFVSQLCRQRALRDYGNDHGQVSLSEMLRDAQKAWHGVQLNQPDWSDHSHSVAFSGRFGSRGPQLYFILNAFKEPLEFELPALERGHWRRWIDTSLASPEDVVPFDEMRSLSEQRSYTAGHHSVVMLAAQIDV